MYYELVAFFSAMGFLGALRRTAHRFGLLDTPSHRKTHSGAVPVIGGLAIGAGFLTTCFIQGTPSTPFVVGGILILATGLFDDLKEFSARSKFVGQLGAAVIMTSWASLYVTDLGDLFGTGNLLLGSWGIAFTLFCAVGLMNAMNMIDGLDGLAGGIALTAAAWLCTAGSLSVHPTETKTLCILGAAIVAFLFFNLRHPWRRQAVVFLGDAGSMFLGFVLVWFAVSMTQNEPHDLYPISTVWILGVPIMDTVYVMLRRMIRGMSPFEADRRHIHHTLIYLGLSETRTAWVLIALSAAFGGIGVAGWYYAIPEYVLTYGLIGTFAVYCCFMQHWRAILPLLGFKLRHAGFKARKAVTEGP